MCKIVLKISIIKAYIARQHFPGDSLHAVKYGECHYRTLEQDKIIALKTAKGNFDSPMYGGHKGHGQFTKFNAQSC